MYIVRHTNTMGYHRTKGRGRGSGSTSGFVNLDTPLSRSERIGDPLDQRLLFVNTDDEKDFFESALEEQALTEEELKDMIS